MTEFSGQIATPDKILLKPFENNSYLTCIQGNKAPIIQKNLIKWLGLNSEVNLVHLDWDSYQVGLDSSFHGVVDNRYILGGFCPIGVQPPKIAEFDINTGTKLFETSYGDTTDRMSTSVPLANGGLFGITFCEDLSQNIVRFDVCYRRLQVPTGGNVWQFKRFEFPSEFGTAALRYIASGVQVKDGTIWVFFTRDSAGALGLAKFKVDSNNEIVLLECNQKFIPWGLTYSVSGELPYITAIVNKFDRNKVILSYQGSAGVGINCPNLDITSFWTVIELNSLNKSIKHLGTTSWISPHGDFPNPLAIARPDGVYFMLNEINSANCQLNWHLGVLNNQSQFNIAKTINDGNLSAYSDDGWILFYNRVTRITELTKLRFLPYIRIRSQPNSKDLLIDWDEFDPTTDILQKSSDLQDWIDVSYAGSLPVVIYPSKSIQKEFYRVKVNI